MLVSLKSQLGLHSNLQSWLMCSIPALDTYVFLLLLSLVHAAVSVSAFQGTKLRRCMKIDGAIVEDYEIDDQHIPGEVEFSNNTVVESTISKSLINIYVHTKCISYKNIKQQFQLRPSLLIFS